MQPLLGSESSGLDLACSGSAWVVNSFDLAITVLLEWRQLLFLSTLVVECLIFRNTSVFAAPVSG